MPTWCAFGLSQWRYYWLHSVDAQFNLPGAVSCNLLQHHFNKIVIGRLVIIHKTISLPAERIFFLKLCFLSFWISHEWLFTNLLVHHVGVPKEITIYIILLLIVILWLFSQTIHEAAISFPAGRTSRVYIFKSLKIMSPRDWICWLDILRAQMYGIYFSKNMLWLF